MNKSRNQLILLKLKYPTLLIIFLTTLLAFLMSVGPSQSNLLLTLVPLILVWIVSYFLIMTVVTLFKKHSSILSRSIAVSFATVIMLAVMFSALGRLVLFDVVLLVVLSILGIFYLQRTWPK
jgi:hypothetical protein